MPSTLIEKMKKIHETNPNLMDQDGGRTRYFSQARGKGNFPRLDKNEVLVGTQASHFISQSQKLYEQGLNPPYTKEKIQQMYEEFEKLNTDLTGNPNGTNQEKKLAAEWQQFWIERAQEYKKANPEKNEQEISIEIEKRKQDILKGYRFQIISLSEFVDQNNPNNLTLNHRRRTFFVEINSRSKLSTDDCLEKVNRDLMNTFTDKKNIGRNSADSWIALSKEKETEFLDKSREVLLQGLKQAKKNGTKEDVAILKKELLSHPAPLKQKSKAQKFFDGVSRFFNEKGRRQEAFREAWKGEAKKQNSNQEKNQLAQINQIVKILDGHTILKTYLFDKQTKDLTRLQRSLKKLKQTSENRYVDVQKVEKAVQKRLDKIIQQNTLYNDPKFHEALHDFDFRNDAQKKEDADRERKANPILTSAARSIAKTSPSYDSTVADKGLLLITEKEWKKAEEFFKNNPGTTKFKKEKGSDKEHSFIKIGDHIYAMGNRRCVGEGRYGALGRGAFGSVKVIQTRNGENFAIKMEKRKQGEQGNKIVDDVVMHVMREATEDNAVKGHLNMVYRDIVENKQSKDKHGNILKYKFYTVLKLEKGDELGKEVRHLEGFKKNMAAIKACLAVRALHDKGIAHCDLKGANFMCDATGDQILVSPIDFGFGRKFEEGRPYLSGSSKGTLVYMAPELTHEGAGQYLADGKVKFSAYSDVYAMGTMFLREFGFSPEENKIFMEMLRRNPTERKGLDDIIIEFTDYLLDKDKKNPQLKPDEIQTLKDVKQDAVEHKIQAEIKFAEVISKIDISKDDSRARLADYIRYYPNVILDSDDKPVDKEALAGIMLKKDVAEELNKFNLQGKLGEALRSKVKEYNPPLVQQRPELQQQRPLPVATPQQRLDLVKSFAKVMSASGVAPNINNIVSTSSPTPTPRVNPSVLPRRIPGPPPRYPIISNPLPVGTKHATPEQRMNLVQRLGDVLSAQNVPEFHTESPGQYASSVLDNTPRYHSPLGSDFSSPYQQFTAATEQDNIQKLVSDLKSHLQGAKQAIGMDLTSMIMQLDSNTNSLQTPKGMLNTLNQAIGQMKQVNDPNVNSNEFKAFEQRISGFQTRIDKLEQAATLQNTPTDNTRYFSKPK